MLRRPPSMSRIVFSTSPLQKNTYKIFWHFCKFAITTQFWIIYKLIHLYKFKKILKHFNSSPGFGDTKSSSYFYLFQLGNEIISDKLTVPNLKFALASSYFCAQIISLISRSISLFFLVNFLKHRDNWLRELDLIGSYFTTCRY